MLGQKKGMQMKNELTQNEVQRLFDYREDGELIWRFHRFKKMIGKVAGKLESRYYKGNNYPAKRIQVNGRRYSHAKLVWLYHNGNLPNHNLLRKNGNRFDCRIENLYEWGEEEKKEISYELVRELFDYKNGLLIWKKRIARSVDIGSEVNYQNTYGYVIVFIYNKAYYAHRIIWLWHHGYIPENDIDHVNRDKSDNRIENLREVSHQCNMRNLKVRKNNSTCVRGITWDKDRKKYKVQINNGKRNQFVGRFNDLNEAVLCRLAAEQCMDWNRCDANSPAYQYAIEHGLIKPKR